MSLWSWIWPRRGDFVPLTPTPPPPTAVEVLHDEVRYLRQSLEKEQAISERLREEVITLNNSKAHQELEYYRALRAPTTPPPQGDPREVGFMEREVPGENLPWGGSLQADGHVRPEMTEEEVRLEREADARERERLRLAADDEDGIQTE